MSLRIRRGTDAQRTGVTFETGEIVYTTDSKQLWIGDGVTQGGTALVGGNVTGYGLTFNASTKRIEVAGLTADDISNGINNKFFTTELAQDAVAPMFTGGTHTNISFQYDDELGKINATVTLDGIGLTDIVNDTSPQLGGNLDLNNSNITGDGNINITGNISAFGLGASLSLNSYDITGTGNIGFTGNLTVAGNLTMGSTTVDSALVLYNSGTSSYGILNSLAGENTSFLEMQVSKGTFALPLTVASQDIIGGTIFRGYNGTSFERAVAIAGSVDGNPVGGGVPGRFTVITTDAAGTGIQELSFDKNGLLTVPSITVGDGSATVPSMSFSTDASVDTGFFHPGDGIIGITTNGTERARVDGGGVRVEGFVKVKDFNGTLPSPPEAGMIVLDGSTFKGYNGSAWVDLG